MSFVYVCCPTYDTTLSAYTAASLLGTPTKKHETTRQLTQDSALAHGFNMNWCAALNLRESKGLDYFAMIHADVGAPPFWLDDMIADLEEYNCDVLSAVIPIKDDSDETSTAITHGDNNIRKLTMTECDSLPPVFGVRDIADCKYDSAGKPISILRANTGLWVCNFRKSWVEKVWFEFHDRIHKDPVLGWTPTMVPEDWNFSCKCAEMGLNVMATNKMEVLHCGHKAWRSRPTTEGRYLQLQYSKRKDDPVYSTGGNLNEDGTQKSV